MLHAFRSRAAESMIETLISIVVVVLATTAALSMIRTASFGNQVIGEKLVAIELAMEGLDAVKSIRDTNYLLFASNTAECWNRLDATSPSTCSSATDIKDGKTYYVVQDFSSAPLFKWSMELVKNIARNGDVDLFVVDTGLDDAGNATTAGLYADWHNVSSTGFTTITEGAFTRTISIDYSPEDSSGVDQCPTDQCFAASSTVEWTVGDLTQSVSLTRIISNVY